MSRELRSIARAILECADIEEKLAACQALHACVIQAKPECNTALEFLELTQLGRPARPELVLPREVPKRRLSTQEGRAALLHAIAHIEFNAINLACDAVQRFAHMPLAYYLDWASVAVDEARHFVLLQTRLAELGSYYGAFKAHNGLWEMAEKTQHSCLQRMALVPRLLEARGLDVTPLMIEKLKQMHDAESVAVLDIILSEEVRHVAIGTKWFNFCCQREAKNPEQEFIELLTGLAKGSIRGPFNTRARALSGFTDFEMQQLGILGQRVN